MGRRDLFRLWRRRPSEETQPGSEPATTAPVPQALPAFSLGSFYSGRAGHSEAAFPSFSPNIDAFARGAEAGCTARGTPELAAPTAPPPPWATRPTRSQRLAAHLVPLVRKDTCLAYRSVCSVCVERCPEEGAITLLDGRPLVVPERCTGCGACVGACPAPINGFSVVARANEAGA